MENYLEGHFEYTEYFQMPLLFKTNLSKVLRAQLAQVATVRVPRIVQEQLSADASQSKSVLPDWFDRPGAPEAVKVGADLRSRNDRLGEELGVLSDEGAQLLQKVLSYEEEHDQLKEWLTGEKGRIEELSPPTITTAELRQQLKEVEVSSSSSSSSSSNPRQTHCVQPTAL